MLSPLFHRVHTLFTLQIALLTALALVCPAVMAADTDPVALKSIATDGKTYATGFGVGITRSNNTTQISSANVNESLILTGYIYPDPAHTNKNADVFVVMVDTSTGIWYMRTLEGFFVKWSGFVADLVPTQENVMLTATYSLPIYTGTFANPATQLVFVGYMSKVSPALIYTPAPASFTITAATAPVNPLTFFTDNIENVLIQTRCIVCHNPVGLAKDTKLVYERSSTTSTLNNYNTLKNFINSRPDALSYMLTKVTGGNNHGGGAPVSPGSSDYNAMSGFIQLVTGNSNVTLSDAASFFNGVTLQPRVDTLRKAALMVAGRLPTATETAAVSSGDENTLRTTLRGLLSGTGFHKFLTEGANDRLLTENPLQGQVIDAAWGNFVKLVNTIYTMKSDAIKNGSTTAQANSLASNYYNTVADFGLKASVEEQVAYVVENEKPYTEILTGDYMMMTPRINFLLEGDAIFKNPNDMYEYQPGRIGGYYTTPTVSWTRDALGTFTTLNKGSVPTKVSHIGILNNLGFLIRYPSTPTNRNRARARWTLLNFMDIDIEKSTQRSTDPAALADKNNPTMNNPNCYACHERMDPVAAAFQNYYDFGYYLLWGTDSLDLNYKATTAYKKGDKWYSDMRTPGLLGHAITNTAEPLRDLATMITQDPAFARATVKFWWPSVMNSSVLLAPAVSSDADYQDKLAAYQAQATSIEQFATSFNGKYNLKDLLVDMMMSPWFRIDGNLASTNTNASLIAGVSTRKLLTPERLQRKTLALTGFNWRSSTFPRYEGRFIAGLTDDYRLLYGGIDSQSIIERVRDMTPVMGNVAQTLAVEASCPIVLKDFALPDAQRKLFAGITDLMTPLTEGSTVQIPNSSGASDWVEINMAITLNPGSKYAALNLLNPYCDYDTVAKVCRSQRALYLDNVQIKAPGDSVYTTYEITSSVSNSFTSGCLLKNTNDALTYGCDIKVPFTATTAGTYQIKARVAAVQAGSGKIQAWLAVLDSATALQSTSNGAKAIKTKLAELHRILHGKNYAIDAPEITAAYKLFVDSWQSKVNTPNSSTSLTTNQCLWGQDWNFLDGLGYTGTVHVVAAAGNFYTFSNIDAINAFLSDYAQDALHTKQSWEVVLTYLMGHYYYLYE